MTDSAMTGLRYVGEWLTVEQACRALRVNVDQLRQLHVDGDLVGEYIRPGVWRVRTSTVDDLRATSEWKARTR